MMNPIKLIKGFWVDPVDELDRATDTSDAAMAAALRDLQREREKARAEGHKPTPDPPTWLYWQDYLYKKAKAGQPLREQTPRKATLRE